MKNDTLYTAYVAAVDGTTAADIAEMSLLCQGEDPLIRGATVRREHGVWLSPNGVLYTEPTYRLEMLASHDYCLHFAAVCEALRKEYGQECVLWFARQVESGEENGK